MTNHKFKRKAASTISMIMQNSLLQASENHLHKERTRFGHEN